ncbi:hypothetical protein K443DRAFT_670913 [Laccaria amethystina LaAM-08-1]|uniref:RRM domain-containing protein n=1 Tax=Laccaria amethystina LaAM-08-1 TaxID=1095629 RepID=A0A0C9YIY0_9AGAR|nr:hypothetical protein K443DRAFT_670913 [Laccaria amethystina LaAM-08-1]
MAPTAKPTKKDSKSKQKALVTSKEQDSISKPAKSLKRKETENLDENNDVVALKASRKTKKLKAPTPEPEPSAEEEEQDVAAEDSGENDTHLHGFSTDDDDSSDEEDIAEEEPSTFDVAKLPTIAKDDAIVKRKLEKAKRNPTEDRGVLFLGRLPHGFYEEQMKAYFSQFGNVTRLRISRNKKTGKSKHYGFLEFDSSSVAQIVADTMDNYLIMGHILRCKVIPKDEVHPELWVGANRKWRGVPTEQVVRAAHNKPRTEEEQRRAAKRLLKRQKERKRKLAEAGIKYNLEAVGYKKVKNIKA